MQIIFSIGLIASLFSPHTVFAQEIKPAEFRQFLTQANTLATSTILESSTPSLSQNAQYIAEQAQKAGLDVQMVLTVADKESHFDPIRTGDEGQSRGVFQISRVWHPEVSDECAYDLECATEWAIKTMIQDDGCNQWSTCPIK